MALDIAKLREQQAELEKKSSGNSKNFINVSKIDGPIDVRIMDPLPSMQGTYFVEVPVWWINGKRVVSPQLFGATEKDVVENVIEEAKRSNDPELKKLLNAVGDNQMPKIQKKVEYWIPVLKFNWEIKPSKTSGVGEIQGIYDEKGVADPELIRKFIEDDRVKILQVGINLLKNINEIATSRLGSVMVDQEKGFNITISKSGEKRKTKYSAMKADALPMPADFYTPEKMTDPFEIAQAQIYTDAYADAIIGNYLYGDDVPERDETCYLYPDLREQLKSKLSEEEEPEKPVKRQRPGQAAKEPLKAPAASRTPAHDDLGTATKEPIVPPTRGRQVPPAPPARGVKTPVGRGRRDLVKDLEDTK